MSDVSQSAPAIPLAIRRLLKKIEEAPAAELSTLFNELPRVGTDLPLFTALLAIPYRQELVAHLFKYFSNLSSERCDDPHFSVVSEWATKHLKDIDEEHFKKYIDWIMRRVYKASELKPDNPSTQPFVARLTKWFCENPARALAYLKSESYVYDLWSASLTPEEQDQVATAAVELPDEPLISFFKLLSDQRSNSRSRDGELPGQPWLQLMRSIWRQGQNHGPKIARCYISGWRSGDSKENGSADLMCELLDAAEEPQRSILKAAAYSLAVPYVQHLAKKNASPIFDPVTCFVIVKSALPDDLYGATKWAMELADLGKLAMMVDIVVADVVSSKASVHRRLPAFFLMAGQLHDLWSKKEAPEIAEAMKHLARHWTLYREQFQRECEAEKQTHYFSSNAEEVEKHMGKVLVRTQL